MRILIAEDDPISSRILTTSLKAWGHECVVTNNGADALAALQKEDAPLLAILDWMMPGLTGVEICRRLRTERSEAPIYIILLTALNCKENLLEGLEAGADDYLTKPFDRHELRVRVQAGARIVALQENLRQRVRELEQELDGEQRRFQDSTKNLAKQDRRNRELQFQVNQH